MSNIPHITFPTGQSVPQFGLGTWELTGEACRKSVADALAMGYRHIDTAVGYNNHTDVAAGIKDSGVARDSFFLTTKIPPSKLSRSQVIEVGKTSVKELGVEYVDLLLIHWPTRKVPLEETIGAMNELVKSGITRAIGVSNFNKDLVTEACRLSDAPICTNQVEYHPYLNQTELLETCTDLGVVITAYSPLTRGKVFSDENLQAIAVKHKTTVSQVVIAWLISKGIIVIPKATGKAHLEDNLAGVSLQLDVDDVTTIENIPETIRLVDGSWVEYPF